MSVVGSLEDLSFPDVLQLIHASRRSGTLILTMRDGERRVRFVNGLVRGATLGPHGPELEDLLLARGLIGASALEGARARAARDGTLIVWALVDGGAVSQDDVERLVREEIKSSLRALVLTQEGEFRFDVLADTPEADHILLLAEGSVARLALERALRGAGFRISLCGTAGETLDRARTLSLRGEPFHVVVDLLLPGDGGEGWQGGLELVRRVRQISPGARGVLLGESRSASAGAAAHAAGVSAAVPFPDLAEAEWKDIGRILSEFAGRVVGAILDPRSVAARGATARPLRVVDQLSLLRGLVGQLHAEQEIEIPLLVLRLATEYLERGVLFKVEDGLACGTGAFGGGREGSDDLDSRVRGAAVPMLPGSILETAVRTRSPYFGPIAPDGANAPLIEKLGAPLPREAAVLPVLGRSEVLAILYGDNGGSTRPVGDLRGLEIFVAQAGIALENASLQRRLAAIPGRDRSAPDA